MAWPSSCVCYADTLIPNLTVYEMLMYTAELKNSRKMPLAEKREKVLDHLVIVPCCPVLLLPDSRWYLHVISNTRLG